jgi:hypothetical protein
MKVFVVVDSYTSRALYRSGAVLNVDSAQLRLAIFLVTCIKCSSVLTQSPHQASNDMPLRPDKKDIVRQRK